MVLKSKKDGVIMANYNFILNELFNYYQKIYSCIENEYGILKDKETLLLNFNTDFLLSSSKQNDIIKYDFNSKKFLLSYEGGIEKYNNFKQNIDIDFDINYKLNNNVFDYYSKNDISSIIQVNNISFIEYVKSEFLKEYFNKIIHLTSSSKEIEYSDDFGTYKKNKGDYFNYIICEVESRMFAKKYNLLFIPRSIGNKRMLLFAKGILYRQEIKTVVLNETIDSLEQVISNKKIQIIEQYEQNCFEQEFKIKNGTLQKETYSNISRKSVKELRKELNDMIAMVKSNIGLNKNSSSNPVDSFGYANISIVFCLLVTFLIITITIFILTLGGYR